MPSTTTTTTRRSALATAALAAAAAFAAVAAPAAAHEGPRKGPNGGQMVDVGAHHAELVAEGTALRLFLFDGQDRPVAATGASARAVVVSGGRQGNVALAPARDNVLEGSGEVPAAPGMRVVVTLTMPGEARPAQARFTPLDQR